MKSFFLKLIALFMFCFFFFFLLPMFNKKDGKELNGVPELYAEKMEQSISESDKIALFGEVIPFPFVLDELPEEFHIEDMYYNDMTDGIDAGDYFHCNVLDEKNEVIAYIRVSNLKENRVESPEGMTVTYMVAESFQRNGVNYSVPFEVINGIGIGSSYEEVQNQFPEMEQKGKDDYRIERIKVGTNTVTLEFLDQIVYKMSIEASLKGKAAKVAEANFIEESVMQ